MRHDGTVGTPQQAAALLAGEICGTMAQRACRGKPRRYNRQEINGAAAGPSGDAAASRGATSGGRGAVAEGGRAIRIPPRQASGLQVVVGGCEEGVCGGWGGFFWWGRDFLLFLQVIFNFLL